MKHRVGTNTWGKALLTTSLVALLITSCTYKDRVQPIVLPAAADNTVMINGLYISAVAYVEAKKARDAFGYDIRKAGLLPVQLTFQNEGERSVQLVPEQSFLIDAEQQAWPINTLERTYKRVEKHVQIGETVASSAKPALLLGAAGAVAGLAVGIVTGEDIGESIGKGAAVGAAAGALAGGTAGYAGAREKIRTDMKNKSLANKQILPNQIGYGVLFFPGYPEEAGAAVLLKLTLSFDGEVRTVNLDLLPRSH